ncbi:hypothetical protein DDE82_009059 [Stemphylium lycopersici]|uniref:Uncharacterized protein n=1 Tax=Stemphylium lycopersici TaxID=183478 RepID=A0A364MRD0_STELY|nr:hypothetical protein TW65_07083 [Stemphylium lycopersici]RAQ98636.1 hypothetical protein DDE82_009059 [Stemphylium lycopersici]RAR00489.1 hypothetical protein DDE83_009100 [Stemphylium lycopersici]
MPKSQRRVRFCQIHIYASETMLEEKTVHRVSSHDVVLIRYSYLLLPLSLSTQRPPYERTRNTDRERFLLSGQVNPTGLSQLVAAKFVVRTQPCTTTLGNQKDTFDAVERQPSPYNPTFVDMTQNPRGLEKTVSPI